MDYIFHHHLNCIGFAFVYTVYITFHFAVLIYKMLVKLLLMYKL